GVPEAELPRLFHRFVTSGNATPNSTGIGLAISRAIVERHHGSITAENTADGLLVTLCFPLIDGIEKLSYENVS
ncbi:MAG: ATP-binding protein, partial [Clostridia bacterium]|nr:ATP-binding protein [Clostridia bacterium]